jgi:hypothetical protein
MFMYIKALLLVTALGATALPATAQSYNNCRDRNENSAGGAVLGAVLGGVLGSNIAASGHRHDGTAVGAVLGGLVGSQVGRGMTNCDSRYQRAPDYPVAQYPAGQYPQPSQSQYQSPPPSGTYSPYYPSYPNWGGAAPPPADYGYYPDAGYGQDDDYRDDSYGRGKSKRRSKDLYGDGTRDYRYNDGYAGRDCDTATQITRLPDGTEIRRPVEACRDAYYGDWRVRD